MTSARGLLSEKVVDCFWDFLSEKSCCERSHGPCLCVRAVAFLLWCIRLSRNSQAKVEALLSAGRASLFCNPYVINW